LREKSRSERQKRAKLRVLEQKKRKKFEKNGKTFEKQYTNCKFYDIIYARE
jgi:hypothetical protein